MLKYSSFFFIFIISVVEEETAFCKCILCFLFQSFDLKMHVGLQKCDIIYFLKLFCLVAYFFSWCLLVTCDSYRIID